MELRLVSPKFGNYKVFHHYVLCKFFNISGSRYWRRRKIRAILVWPEFCCKKMSFNGTNALHRLVLQSAHNGWKTFLLFISPQNPKTFSISKFRFQTTKTKLGFKQKLAITVSSFFPLFLWLILSIGFNASFVIQKTFFKDNILEGVDYHEGDIHYNSGFCCST